MKAAPLRLPKVGNVYIIKNLSASFPQLVKRERKIHLLPFFLVPARQPIFHDFIAFDCPFGVF